VSDRLILMGHPTAMPTDDQTLRKQLLFRSWHRGTREMDLILGQYAERHLPGMDRQRLDLYARLLEKSDPDIYMWLTGREALPADIDGEVWRSLMASFVASEDANS
jgi:antitoxin CptB